MQELKIEQVKDVNGGLAPLAVWAVKAAVGAALGTGATVAKSAHTSHQARKSCEDGVASAGVLSYTCK